MRISSNRHKYKIINVLYNIFQCLISKILAITFITFSEFVHSKTIEKFNIEFNYFRVSTVPGVPICNVYEVLDSFNSFLNDSELMSSSYGEYVMCINACEPPCERFQYEITVVNANIPSQNEARGGNNLTTQLNFIISNVQNMIVYEQVWTYNAHSFISNIGSQLGLWCGASVISVVHLFFWLTESLISKIKSNNTFGVLKIKPIK